MGLLGDKQFQFNGKKANDPEAYGTKSPNIFDSWNIMGAANIINAHPGVSHNYRRNHDFNERAAPLARAWGFNPVRLAKAQPRSRR